MTLLIIELNWFVAIQPDNQIPYFWEDFSSLIYQLQRVLVVDTVSNFLDAIFVDFVIPAVEQIQGNLRGQVVLRTSRVFLNVKQFFNDVWDLQSRSDPEQDGDDAANLMPEEGFAHDSQHAHGVGVANLRTGNIIDSIIFDLTLNEFKEQYFRPIHTREILKIRQLTRAWVVCLLRSSFATMLVEYLCNQMCISWGPPFFKSQEKADKIQLIIMLDQSESKKELNRPTTYFSLSQKSTSTAAMYLM